MKISDIIMAFVEAIEALGGRVLPKQIHDDPWTVDVPKRHEAKAKELLLKLEDDLKKARPS